MTQAEEHIVNLQYEKVALEAYADGRADQLQADIDDLIEEKCRVGAFILSKKRSETAVWDLK